jgi:hypothetical protein
MVNKLRCHERFDLGPQQGLSRQMHVVDKSAKRVPTFELMCQAIDADIESAEGSGTIALEDIDRIESGKLDSVEADGNAWVAHISLQRVWFEGLYGQGEGGEVSFAQYKLAVQTYVRFLADPDRKTIEIDFPT